MNSIIIGIARTGDSDNHLLSPDINYISMCGSYPEVSFSINCKQQAFYENVKLLRYNDADPGSSEPGISFFQELITRILKDLKYLSIDNADKTPLHIRLITAPIELAQLPFEFGLDPSGSGKPLLLNPDRMITLTREVRQTKEARYNWPAEPRILFAWSQPTDPVPHEKHARVLLDLVRPLAKPKEDIFDPEPDTDSYFVELQNASLKSIGKELENGIAADRPYTHIHILAHGGHTSDFTGLSFRLVLCDSGNPNNAVKISGAELARALVKNESVPVVVSLSACDSGNIGNVIASGSLVQQLHNEGIPCVFASQFPLTQEGSVKMTETLYTELINACDPRLALYKTRLALKDSHHDWASLVAYARFPEDINEQLQNTQLKMVFNSMKTTAAWVDHVFKFNDKIAQDKKESIFKDLNARLDKSIEQLSGLLTENNKSESSLKTAAAKSEHFGLLGSAYKRKAEYLYRLIDLQPADKQRLLDESLQALKIAKDFYGYGFEANTASHWNAMQYLSLNAIINGLVDSDVWTIVKFMAQKEEKKPPTKGDRIWSWGTLSELFMLQPLISSNPSATEIETDLAEAKRYITMLSSAEPQFSLQKESTARQFERYIFWWPQLISSGYMELLKRMASEIRKILPAPEHLT